MSEANVFTPAFAAPHMQIGQLWSMVTTRYLSERARPMRSNLQWSRDNYMDIFAMCE